MVRLIDGFPDPFLIFFGWISSIVLLVILFRLKPNFGNDEIAEYATLGAVVFVVQSVFIPITSLPIVFSLSGIPLVITIKGARKGLIISSPAIILNHIIIPGSFTMLGLNLTNMLLAGLVSGLIPAFIYQRMGRRIRYLSGFLGGISYFIAISIIIILEFSVSNLEVEFSNLVFIIFSPILFLALFEGFLTAIGSSYYHRMKSYIEITPKKKKEEIPIDKENNDDDDDDEMEKIEFLR